MPGEQGFLIRMRSGEDAGPYSTEQLHDLLDQGRIPGQLRILDVASGRTVAAQEAVAAAEASGSYSLQPIDLDEDPGGQPPTTGRSRGGRASSRAGRGSSRATSRGGGGRSRRGRGGEVDPGPRPGGLTALAIVNFLLSALLLLIALLVTVVGGLAGTMGAGMMEEMGTAGAQMSMEPSSMDPSMPGASAADPSTSADPSSSMDPSTPGASPADPSAAEMAQAFEAMGSEGSAAMKTAGGLIMLLGVLLGLTGILGVLSGIGYLKQKKVMGRILGSVFGGLAVVGMVLQLVGGAVDATILLGVYGLLTLALLNTVWARNLVR